VEQFNLALYLLATGQVEAALQAYQVALTLNPDQFTVRDALRDLADLRTQIGEIPGLDEAERLLQERMTDVEP
jgi:tetratricopeptide (TPR) repeat protein